MNFCMAPAASCSKADLNWAEVMPAVRAMVVSFCPPLSTASPIWVNDWLIAVPPASASIPTEASADE